MPSIILHPEAIAEAEEQALWYELRHKGLGDDFLSELDRALFLIAESPARWPVWPGFSRASGIRRFLLARFPLAVAYEPYNEDVLVHAVVHLARRPGYWKRRLKR